MSYEWACVGVVHRAKVADALEQFPNGLHVDELAKLVGLEKVKLARVLRLLATKGCFIEGKCFHPPQFTPVSYSHLTLNLSRAKRLCEQSPLPGYTFEFRHRRTFTNRSGGCLQRRMCIVRDNDRTKLCDEL